MSTNNEEQNSFVPLVPAAGDFPSIKRAVAANLVSSVETQQHKLTEDQKRILEQFVESTSRGFAGSMTMICSGKNCPFLSACVIDKVGGTLPIGKRCPLEASIVTMWINKHLKMLGIDNPEDPAHSFDMDMLYELAGQELIKWRCANHLSKESALVTNQQVGADINGEPIFADVINPVLDVLERAGKNVAKIREALVATRSAQIQAGHIAVDATQKAADLRAKAKEIAEARRRAQENIKDATYKVIDEKPSK